MRILYVTAVFSDLVILLWLHDYCDYCDLWSCSDNLIIPLAPHINSYRNYKDIMITAGNIGLFLTPLCLILRSGKCYHYSLQ